MRGARLPSGWQGLLPGSARCAMCTRRRPAGVADGIETYLLHWCRTWCARPRLLRPGRIEPLLDAAFVPLVRRSGWRCRVVLLFLFVVQNRPYGISGPLIRGPRRGSSLRRQQGRVVPNLAHRLALLQENFSKLALLSRIEV